ncbi:MAG: septum formation protein Maf [Bacteroidia bacterium]|nr:septum formation protein Maf [Bacteroidia bacterium]NND10173.1 septum formation protein Maf [Flavobacteriaceae bacterium]MBT8310561.1 septum formation protein Maf [Bacteroidia bacterium]NNK26926.1 septum formation protein Maf [Flavobacteriaceae bacterium]NNL61016.1 septum formation protein Maf [Flavobacteriaceae bacterium]
MLKEALKNYHIILASGSPRRHKFFHDLNIEFEVHLKPIKEEYPDRLKHFEITNYLAQLKSLPFLDELADNDILITSDTIVWHENKALGKPRTLDEAFDMLRSMSGKTHEVITSVCLRAKNYQKTVYDITKVTFKEFSDEEITYYVDNYDMMDKAGAYGIQDWIGLIGVTKLEGSYFNVMGLPTHLLYKTLMDIANRTI